MKSKDIFFEGEKSRLFDYGEEGEFIGSQACADPQFRQ